MIGIKMIAGTLLEQNSIMQRNSSCFQTSPQRLIEDRGLSFSTSTRTVPLLKIKSQCNFSKEKGRSSVSTSWQLQHEYRDRALIPFPYDLGANIIAGSSAPVEGLVHAIGLASSVLANTRDPNVLALPSLTTTTGSAVIGATHTMVHQAVASGRLYGAYHNLFVPDVGISAGWNGYVGKPVTTPSALPLVEVKGLAAIPHPPDNMVPPASEFVFVEEGRSEAVALTEAEAVKRSVQISLLLTV